MSSWIPPEDWTPPPKPKGAVVDRPGVLVGKKITGWKQDGGTVLYLVLDGKEKLHIDGDDPYCGHSFRLEK